MTLHSPDLTQFPPRSPRVRLGGYAVLPRLLDKCRAVIAGRPGEYKYACPLDQRWFDFVGIDADELQREVAKGLSDAEVLAWINARSRHKRGAPEIATWSAWQENRAPGEVESRDYFGRLHTKLAPHREDIVTWFDLLDLDDYISFGGKA